MVSVAIEEGLKEMEDLPTTYPHLPEVGDGRLHGHGTPTLTAVSVSIDPRASLPA